MKISSSFIQKVTTTVLLLCSFVYFSIFYLPTTTNACSCAAPPSVESALSKSDVVFSGKVINILEKRSLKGYMTKSVIFEVSKTWKGVENTQIKITTGQGGGDCGIHFVMDENYLVYGRESDMYGKQQLTTIMCDRTNDLVSAQEDLEILSEGHTPLKQIDLTKENTILTSRTDNVSPLTVSVIILAAGFIGYFTWRKIKKG